jgi:hypothetical protein
MVGAEAATPSGSVASGGPLDGQRLGAPECQEFEVTMADRTRHVYRTTARLEQQVDGTTCRVFAWQGRVGLK